ncbi:phosphopantetheine-binding protein [Streptomyces sp. NPDC001777]|uniref:phosphopantetheine-binding protein n=1 Tax=Streptomyces sp. NPDC001777 TaxID=3364608 RepID=UPI0036C7309D
MNHDQAGAFVRQAVPDADFTGLDPDASLRETFEMDPLDFLEFVEALAGLGGRELTEDDHTALDTLNGCVARLLTPAETPARERN